MSEFQCPCCRLVQVEEELVDNLYNLRLALHRPIIITSGYRCKKHNVKVGGNPVSAHMRGAAADIRVPGISPSVVEIAAKVIGFEKVYSNVKQGFTHCGLASLGIGEKDNA